MLTSTHRMMSEVSRSQAPAGRGRVDAARQPPPLFFGARLRSAVRGEVFRIGAANVPQAIAEHVRAEQVAFFGGKLFRELLLEVRGLSGNEKFIDHCEFGAGE